jgi:meso-butanediol dehydrogenase / (S,S)-butanediol dehydrogenase / diacetyl reductase
MTEGLQGQTALVTGAGSGIGRAIAHAFARQGAHVAVVDIDGKRAQQTADAIGEAGFRAVAIEADVASPGDAERAVATCGEALGPPQVLVNNAGVGQLGTVGDLSLDDWDRTFAVNVRSIFLFSRLVIPSMAERESGRIINIASVTGLVASAGRVAYCASKGAVVMLTKAMALDLAHTRITVNAICPGVIETGMTEGSLSDSATRAEKIAKTPLGWLGEPMDIAEGAAYLASAGARFVTGSCLVIDGGWSID